MVTDCLICFGPVRKQWAQPIPCNCRPKMHKYCWESWIAVAGEVCIICRTDNHGYKPGEGPADEGAPDEGPADEGPADEGDPDEGNPAEGEPPVAIVIALIQPRRPCYQFTQRMIFIFTLAWFLYLFIIMAKCARLVSTSSTHDEL